VIDFKKSEWELLEARVDYYAATTSDPDLGDYCYELARDYIENDRYGDRIGIGRTEQNYVGVASDNAFAGRRDDGTYVRLSSTGASDRWRDFASAGLRTSRIDVCATAHCERDVADLAYTVRYGARLPARIRGRVPNRTLISSEDSGDTVYVGGTTADRRGRIYDKGRESSSTYRLGDWRWEVQSRHEPGQSVVLALLGQSSIEPWITTYVEDWFRDRGIPTPLQTPSPTWRDGSRRLEATDEGRIAYLRRCIAPMISRLLAKHDKRQLRQLLNLQYNPEHPERR
jgi:DNA relaxase NicK